MASCAPRTVRPRTPGPSPNPAPLGAATGPLSHKKCVREAFSCCTKVVSIVLAVAINPGAYEPEAVAALHKARELVKRAPHLAFDLSERYPLSSLDSADEASFEVEISDVSEFWLPILLNALSEQAYVLGLKSNIISDFATPTTVNVKCDGRDTACEAFKEHLNSLTEYIHSRRCEP